MFIFNYMVYFCKQDIELGSNLTNGPLQILKQSENKSFINKRQENTAIHLDPEGTLVTHVESYNTGQTVGERVSDSVYFTPTGTPLRELSASPSKCGKNLYSAVYQQGDDKTSRSNCSTLPNNSKLGKSLSSRLTKSAFVKSHRKSRSFSFPFMPYWFGSNASNANTDSNVQSDRNGDNKNGKVHHVLIEREACGSKDYINMNGMNENFEDSNCNECFLKNANYATKDDGLGNPGSEYDECDSLLPQYKELLFNAAENDHTNVKCDDEENFSNSKFRLNNEQNVSSISLSITTSSSKNGTPSSVMGNNAKSSTSNSEILSITTNSLVAAKEVDIAKESSGSLPVSGSCLVSKERYIHTVINDNGDNVNNNSMMSVHCHKPEQNDISERLTYKRNSV